MHFESIHIYDVPIIIISIGIDNSPIICYKT